MEDEVNSPKHYKVFPDMEAIDIIEMALETEELIGYYKGNILKYRLRAGEKGDAEKDIAKANWYKKRMDEFTRELSVYTDYLFGGTADE